ncbi:hypothetical protein CY34DRAFT_108996 [Suillus luteus UH-Slu-Lm8-n1]|uniref:Uncharacterized protein n=1 Tax=Suillus luteus UH-Slu-Lm8-n1 TaxID=930992 RepID=A0A0D0ATR5_9AGAM|nr:hypothetical protein CY34DRAFT_108996 [Suillus luteus UH-Slu-Lm8-n1]
MFIVDATRKYSYKYQIEAVGHLEANTGTLESEKKETNYQEVFEDEESDKKSDEKSEVEAKLEEMFPEMEFGFPSEGAIDNPKGNTLEGDNISQWYFITPHCLQLLSPFDGDIMNFNIHSEEEENDKDEEEEKDEDYHPSVEDKQLSITHEDNGELNPILIFLNDDKYSGQLSEDHMDDYAACCNPGTQGSSFQLQVWKNEWVISLAKLCLAIYNEIQRLKTTLQDLLPITCDLSSFSLDLIHDSSDDCTSLFDKEDKKTVFNGFIENLWDMLGQGSGTLVGKDSIVTQKNRLHPMAATHFLHTCEEQQKCLIHSVFTTIGICLRLW